MFESVQSMQLPVDRALSGTIQTSSHAHKDIPPENMTTMPYLMSAALQEWCSSKLHAVAQNEPGEQP